MTAPPTPAHDPTLPTRPGVPAERASWWEDYIDIFVAPREVFERRRNAGFAVPLVVFVVLIVALAIAGRNVLAPMFDAEFTRGLARAAQQRGASIPPERLEEMRRVNEKLLPLYSAVFAVVAPLVVGVVLWGAARIVGVRIRAGAAMMIAVYSYFPRVLEQISSVAQGYFMDPARLDSHYRLMLSPARFLDPETTSPIVLALLSRVDLFVLWVTVLLAIGLSAVARIPRSRAAAAAAIVYVVGSLGVIIGAIRQG